ncbi:hypothetical protein PGT21_024982 [Puccinia graminis f. sp. tritici]|uniref:Uncharacterized protein n=1 Tax=Puccinia graminis f. sp. tritici TaxID=56615 RepID=A0A5B0NVW3_PUCGR|nr:hypothetical protein PGT21_024982 [Puccinia graminis f. sp. tritici]
MEEMERQRQELDRMMEESNLQPETEYQYTKIQQPLEQLNEGLRGAGLERILRLSGITSTDFLATGSGKPPARRVTFNEHGPTKSLQPSSSGNNYKAYRRPAFKWNKLRACMTFPQSKSELNRQPSSTVGTEHRRSRRPAPRLLEEEEEEDKTADEGSHSSSCSSTTTITSPYHPSLKRLLSPDPHQGSSIPAGDPERDHELQILAGSPLVSLFFGHQDAGDRPARNQLTILQLIDLWDSLQNKLFKLTQSESRPSSSSSSRSSSVWPPISSNSGSSTPNSSRTSASLGPQTSPKSPPFTSTCSSVSPPPTIPRLIKLLEEIGARQGQSKQWSCPTSTSSFMTIPSCIFIAQSMASIQHAFFFIILTTHF